MARRSRAQTGGRTGQGSAPDETAADGGFPLVVAALSTLAALALFFTSTIPAIRESQYVQRVELERQQLHTMLWQELDAAATLRMALRIDIQSLLVELDRQGVFAGAIVGVAPPSPPNSSTDLPDFGAADTRPQDPR